MTEISSSLPPQQINETMSAVPARTRKKNGNEDKKLVIKTAALAALGFAIGGAAFAGYKFLNPSDIKIISNPLDHTDVPISSIPAITDGTIISRVLTAELIGGSAMFAVFASVCLCIKKLQKDANNLENETEMMNKPLYYDPNRDEQSKKESIGGDTTGITTKPSDKEVKDTKSKAKENLEEREKCVQGLTHVGEQEKILEEFEKNKVLEEKEEREKALKEQEKAAGLSQSDPFLDPSSNHSNSNASDSNNPKSVFTGCEMYKNFEYNEKDWEQLKEYKKLIFGARKAKLKSTFDEGLKSIKLIWEKYSDLNGDKIKKCLLDLSKTDQNVLFKIFIKISKFFSIKKLKEINIFDKNSKEYIQKNEQYSNLKNEWEKFIIFHYLVFHEYFNPKPLNEIIDKNKTGPSNALQLT